MARVKQKLDDARKQREGFQQVNVYSSGAVRDRHSFIPQYDSVTSLNGNRTLPLLIAAVIITSALLVWWLMSSNENRSDPFSRVEVIGKQQTVGPMSTTIEEINDGIAALAVQLDSVTKSIASLDTRLANTQLAINAITTT
jgi:hypothetical protein